jgi:CHAT domain-containing protein/tetratricopeptide (TPR) repeat protein
VLLVAATATSARAQSDRPPIFDVVPGVEPSTKSNPDPAQVQVTDEFDALNQQVVRLYQAGKYAEATEIAKQLLANKEKKLGPDHPQVAAILNDLAFLYRTQGHHHEAEPLLKRSLAIYEKAHGPDHPEVATVLNNLAVLYNRLGRYADVEPLLKRALDIYEKVLPPDHPEVAGALNNLAATYRAEARYDEAEPLYKRALAIFEKNGPEEPDATMALNNLGVLYKVQGRYAEAEPLLRRSLAINEKVLRPDHPQVARALGSLASLYHAQGRYTEAEPLLKRSLAIFEEALELDHPEVAGALNDLAALYDSLDRYADAEPLLKRVLAIDEKALGLDHPDVATDLANLAQMYRTQGRFAEAELFYKRALAINEKTRGLNNPDVASNLNSLAALYVAQGRYSDAEPLMKRSLAMREKVLGPEHTDVAMSLGSLAILYDSQERYTDAEPLMKRALAIDEKALGLDHPDVATDLNNLAVLSMEQGEWARAVEFWRRGISILTGRLQRGTSGGRESLTGKARSEVQRANFQFNGLIKVIHRLALQQPYRAADEARETFEIAQWALTSDAAASLAQMAARSSKGDPALTILVRERQDLVAEWKGRDAVRTKAESQLREKRHRDAEATNSARLDAIDKRIGDIDIELKDKFPEYAALASPAPLSLADVQSLLGSDEALVLFLDTPEWKRKPTTEETFIWVVTKTNVRWVRSDLGTLSLQREVTALRCGLDYDGTWGAEGSDCSELLNSKYTEVDYRFGKPLPFDLERAHALYTALFGQVEDIIQGKHLLIVPSGALTQLPFQVLITKKPDQTASLDFRRAAWLVRNHALTVLPSVSSLKALRQLAKTSHANRTLIGFGNPLLDGPDARYAKWASEARSKQSCPKAGDQRVAAQTIKRISLLPLKQRSGLVEVADVRSQVPLPETADELCAVARDLGVSGEDIRLGQRATETEIKRLSTEGELSKYRLLHFATHGALAGQLGNGSEPGLLLTPPETSTETDDGYLSASEIAALKLDADWVILSACNTAGGGAPGAEALSGLARAFFYAGARSLLVSHWAVDSPSTVKLITKALAIMSSDKTVGRAEAVRRSMLAMIESGNQKEAHPAYWAPFIVVGEGSRVAPQAPVAAVPQPAKKAPARGQPGRPTDHPANL